MGSGPARELESDSGPKRELDPELSSRLAAALAKLDAVDTTFKNDRDETRFAQRSKAWGALCKEIDGYLRTVSNVLHDAHQLALEIGSDGGGHNTKPWIEEASRKYGRLVFRLDGGDVHAAAGDRHMASTTLRDLSYEWVESTVAEWVVTWLEVRK